MRKIKSLYSRDVRKKFASLIQDVTFRGYEVIINHYGTPVAMVMPIREGIERVTWKWIKNQPELSNSLKKLENEIKCDNCGNNILNEKEFVKCSINPGFQTSIPNDDERAAYSFLRNNIFLHASCLDN